MGPALSPGNDPALSRYGIRLNRAVVDVIHRPEGYREFRCTPAWFSQERVGDVELITESGELRWGDDPDGLGDVSEIWSASIAALRMAETPVDLIDERQHHVAATRRLVGLNFPPTLQLHTVETDHVPNWQGAMWSQFGFDPARPIESVFGWGLQDRAAPVPRSVPGSRRGRWFRFTTVEQWQRWPRGQDAAGLAVEQDSGELALFVSHRWEKPHGPDAFGWQLRTLQSGVPVAVAAAVIAAASPSAPAGSAMPPAATESGLPEALLAHFEARFGPRWWAERGLRRWAHAVAAAARRCGDPETLLGMLASIRPPVNGSLRRLLEDIVIWFDYSSMDQEPRTADEEAAFREELTSLGEIQRGATTVALQTGADYLGRAWCFLEFATALRGQLTELRADPDRRLRATERVRQQVHANQLIGALATLGPAAIRHCGLQATEAADLLPIAGLLVKQPLVNAVWSDESDLLGGALPYPNSDGRWVARAGRRSPPPATRTLTGRPLHDAGRVPDRHHLAPTSATPAGADALVGPVGLWTFAADRTLSLAWAARAIEIWQSVKQAVAGGPSDLPIPATVEPVVAAAWTDLFGVADDAEGWTRAVPSTVQLLVIATQREVSTRCLIIQSVVDSHLAAGVHVLVTHPFDGLIEVHAPVGEVATYEPGDVLARRRMRRDSCRINELFVDQSVTAEQVEVMTALRRRPRDGMLTIEMLRHEVQSHPEWGFDPTLDDGALLDHLSRHDLTQRIPSS